MHINNSVYRNDPECRKALETVLESTGIVSFSFGDAPMSSTTVLVGKSELKAEKMNRMALLRHVIVPYAGPAKAIQDELKRLNRRVRVYNSHHNAACTAEMCVALLLAAAKRVPQADAMLRTNNWLGRGMYPSRRGESTLDRGLPQLYLRDKTALVVGLGAVGRRVADVLNALGMDVLATRRSITTPKKISERVHVFPANCLSDLLTRAHVVILCVPGTTETVSLIGHAELQSMRRDAVLVNVARGSVIDETALYDHLKANKDFVAALDTWWRYPSPNDDAGAFAPSHEDFRALPNVLMSPHRCGGIGHKEVEKQRYESIAEILRDIQSGRGPSREFKLSRGY